MFGRPFDRDSVFSLFIGPLVWMAHFVAIYLVTAIACAKAISGWTVLGVGIVPTVVLVATLPAVALILWAAVSAWRRCDRTKAGKPGSAQHRHDSDRRRDFMAYAALLLCGLSLVAVLWETLPVFLLTPCW